MRRPSNKGRERVIRDFLSRNCTEDRGSRIVLTVRTLEKWEVTIGQQRRGIVREVKHVFHVSAGQLHRGRSGSATKRNVGTRNEFHCVRS